MWEQLSVNKPHLAYLIIGGFTSLFMLVSLFVKEKMYIGEATVATICGIIFGPHAANAFNPMSWGNTDQITLECSRIVLVVQCFAVGVELPKAYMERHWRSVVFLLVPVMTFGWLMTSLFIWWMIIPLTWLESLMCAACVTATDPVLASSVVGKGKFAKRVPKHLRDLLSAESGCNDGMAFPFIYLSFYLIHYKLDAHHVTLHWFCNTILYECIFGAIYGVMIGYFGRHAIKWADSKDLIDRESFLVFYFVLALFAAGTGATLGTDDLLVGFAAGVGFSNDGWFTEKTEESHVSNVIDLLLNLAYFVYLGSIIPWEQYNNPTIGLTPWRLVVISVFVIFFRRIPVMMALKPLIPDIKTWREALFAGHFGPIGVGAIFAAILARAELETDTTEPLSVVPTDPNAENYAVIQIIWPLTTFLVITSILVHGSSIAVFTLGKRINTLTLTMSYTQVNEEGPSWMNRLPRIQSTAKTSRSRDDISVDSADEKFGFPPGTLPPVGAPGTFLRRQKEEDTPLDKTGGVRTTARRKSKWDSGMGPGGPISESAIWPARRTETGQQESTSDTLTEKSGGTPGSSDENEPPDAVEMEAAEEKREENDRQRPKHVEEPAIEAFEEGGELVVEDEEGNVLSVDDIRGETEKQKEQHLLDDEAKLQAETTGEHAKGKFHPHAKNEGEEIEKAVAKGVEHPSRAYESLRKRFEDWKGFGREAEPSQPKVPERKHGPAHAYHIGHTVILEDEDGEVITTYDIPPVRKGPRGRGGIQNTSGGFNVAPVRQGLKRMGSWAPFAGKPTGEASGTGAADSNAKASSEKKKRKNASAIDPDDDRIRFTVGTGGRRMSKQDFIQQLQNLGPGAQVATVEGSDVPEAVKQDVRADYDEKKRRASQIAKPPPAAQGSGRSTSYTGATPLQSLQEGQPLQTQELGSGKERPDPKRRESQQQEIPIHNVADSVSRYGQGRPESAAQRRRRIALQRQDSDDDGTARIPPHHHHHTSGEGSSSQSPNTRSNEGNEAAEGGETQAERRRRLAALGEAGEGAADDSSDSDDSGGERQPRKGHHPVAEPDQAQGSAAKAAPGIRFADTPASSFGRVQWSEGVGTGSAGGGKKTRRK
ncbi:MAG: hypothetical protein Q9214_000691 [Letrouitia sp. 1 TL-2023]